MKIEKRYLVTSWTCLGLMALNLVRHLLFLCGALSYRSLWGSMVTNRTSIVPGEWIYVGLALGALLITLTAVRHPLLVKRRGRLFPAPMSLILKAGLFFSALFLFLSAIGCLRSDLLLVRLFWGGLSWLAFGLDLYFFFLRFLLGEKAKRIVRKHRLHH
ncbi:MAG: hypothetical protein ACI39G_03800 [Pseudoramibacter sp.]